jgi:adenylosuccinate synthase
MNLAVLGAQWGDEGKGKIVDLLAPHFSIVARYQGGHNAGHTVYVGGRKFVLRLIPSGILHPSVTCVIGNGLVVDLQALFQELDEIGGAGVETSGRLLVSDKAHLILPYHRDLDLLAEARRGEQKIGTTSRGIGPAYEDKVARRGIRVCDLADLSGLEDVVRENVHARNRLIGDVIDYRPLVDDLRARAVRLAPLVADVSVYLARAMAEGRTILFEGAQGTFLDIDHGTYPFVTSSNASVGGVCTGLGVGPRAIGAVMGVAKAYTTRVGAGPLPTELFDAVGDRLRESGQEYGAVTGRPRRCGWFDAVAVRYAARINGFEEIPVCVGYRLGGDTLTEFPSDLRLLARAEPIYERLPGWADPTRGIRRFHDLPRAAQTYVARLEEITGVPVAIVSTGSDRDDTIVRDDSRAAEWLGAPATSRQVR